MALCKAATDHERLPLGMVPRESADCIMYILKLVESVKAKLVPDPFVRPSLKVSQALYYLLRASEHCLGGTAADHLDLSADVAEAERIDDAELQNAPPLATTAYLCRAFPNVPSIGADTEQLAQVVADVAQQLVQWIDSSVRPSGELCSVDFVLLICSGVYQVATPKRSQQSSQEQRTMTEADVAAATLQRQERERMWAQDDEEDGGWNGALGADGERDVVTADVGADDAVGDDVVGDDVVGDDNVERASEVLLLPPLEVNEFVLSQAFTDAVTQPTSPVGSVEQDAAEVASDGEAPDARKPSVRTSGGACDPSEELERSMLRCARAMQASLDDLAALRAEVAQSQQQLDACRTEMAEAERNAKKWRESAKASKPSPLAKFNLQKAQLDARRIAEQVEQTQDEVEAANGDVERTEGDLDALREPETAARDAGDEELLGIVNTAKEAAEQDLANAKAALVEMKRKAVDLSVRAAAAHAHCSAEEARSAGEANAGATEKIKVAEERVGTLRTQTTTLQVKLCLQEGRVGTAYRAAIKRQMALEEAAKKSGNDKTGEVGRLISASLSEPPVVHAATATAAPVRRQPLVWPPESRATASQRTAFVAPTRPTNATPQGAGERSGGRQARLAPVFEAAAASRPEGKRSGVTPAGETRRTLRKDEGPPDKDAASSLLEEVLGERIGDAAMRQYFTVCMEKFQDVQPFAVGFPFIVDNTDMEESKALHERAINHPKKDRMWKVNYRVLPKAHMDILIAILYRFLRRVRVEAKHLYAEIAAHKKERAGRNKRRTGNEDKADDEKAVPTRYLRGDRIRIVQKLLQYCIDHAETECQFFLPNKELINMFLKSDDAKELLADYPNLRYALVMKALIKFDMIVLYEPFGNSRLDPVKLYATTQGQPALLFKAIPRANWEQLDPLSQRLLAAVMTKTEHADPYHTRLSSLINVLEADNSTAQLELSVTERLKEELQGQRSDSKTEGSGSLCASAPEDSDDDDIKRAITVDGSSEDEAAIERPSTEAPSTEALSTEARAKQERKAVGKSMAAESARRPVAKRAATPEQFRPAKRLPSPKSSTRPPSPKRRPMRPSSPKSSTRPPSPQMRPPSPKRSSTRPPSPNPSARPQSPKRPASSAEKPWVYLSKQCSFEPAAETLNRIRDNVPFSAIDNDPCAAAAVGGKHKFSPVIGVGTSARDIVQRVSKRLRNMLQRPVTVTPVLCQYEPTKISDCLADHVRSTARLVTGLNDEQSAIALILDRAGHRCETRFVLLAIYVRGVLSVDESGAIMDLAAQHLLPNLRENPFRWMLNRDRTALCGCQGKPSATDKNIGAFGRHKTVGCISASVDGARRCEWANAALFRCIDAVEGVGANTIAHIRAEVGALADKLSAHLAYAAPTAYKNMTVFSEEAATCRLGNAPERSPFALASFMMDASAHIHYNTQEAFNAATVMTFSVEGSIESSIKDKERVVSDQMMLLPDLQLCAHGKERSDSRGIHLPLYDGALLVSSFSHLAHGVTAPTQRVSGAPGTVIVSMSQGAGLVRAKHGKATRNSFAEDLQSATKGRR